MTYCRFGKKDRGVIREVSTVVAETPSITWWAIILSIGCQESFSRSGRAGAFTKELEKAVTSGIGVVGRKTSSSESISVTGFPGEDFLSDRSVKHSGLGLEGAFDLCPQFRSKSLPGCLLFLELGVLFGLSRLSSFELLGHSLGPF